MSSIRKRRHETEEKLVNGTYRGISDRTYSLKRGISNETCLSAGEMRAYMEARKR